MQEKVDALATHLQDVLAGTVLVERAIHIRVAHSILAFLNDYDKEALVEPVQYATAEQKEEIITLLANPAITRPQKTRYLLNINRLTKLQATIVISSLKSDIEYCNDRSEHPSPEDKPA